MTLEGRTAASIATSGRSSGFVNIIVVVTQNPILGVIARRLLAAIPVLLLVSMVSFLLISLTPGDAARQIAGIHAPPGTYERLRTELGLDLPVYEQYWRWVTNALQGDLGTSIYTGVPVASSIAGRLPLTLSLVAGALVVALVVGVTLGVIGANRGGVVNVVVLTLMTLGFAIPSFWVAVQLVSHFAVELPWFPATGYTDFWVDPGEWFRSLVLPVTALALGSIAFIGKFTREAMIDVMGGSHIRMARASGLSTRKVVWSYALKNALLPVLTVSGLQAVGLLGGSVIVESIFGLPGLGSLAIAGANQQDLPVVQGVAVFYTLLVIGISLVVDLCYMWVNPKVRIG